MGCGEEPHGVFSNGWRRLHEAQFLRGLQLVFCPQLPLRHGAIHTSSSGPLDDHGLWATGRMELQPWDSTSFPSSGKTLTQCWFYLQVFILKPIKWWNINYIHHHSHSSESTQGWHASIFFSVSLLLPTSHMHTFIKLFTQTDILILPK